MQYRKSIEVTTLYNEYKHYIHHDRDIVKLKQKVAAIIREKSFVPMMNDLKWLQLQHAVSSLSFAPAYQFRCITDTEQTEFLYLKTIPNHEGDWSNYYHEGMPPLFSIEWIKVRPQLRKHQGRLIADAIMDETHTFVAILNNLSIPYIEDNHIFTIFGYKSI